MQNSVQVYNINTTGEVSMTKLRTPKRRVNFIVNNTKSDIEQAQCKGMDTAPSQQQQTPQSLNK